MNDQYERQKARYKGITAPPFGEEVIGHTPDGKEIVTPVLERGPQTERSHERQGQRTSQTEG
jgi:hypothetical protein